MACKLSESAKNGGSAKVSWQNSLSWQCYSARCVPQPTRPMLLILSFLSLSVSILSSYYCSDHRYWHQSWPNHQIGHFLRAAELDRVFIVTAFSWKSCENCESFHILFGAGTSERGAKVMEANVARGRGQQQVSGGADSGEGDIGNTACS